MKMRLKELLKKNNKSKEEFVKYLKSLDFNEFVDLYTRYTIPFARLANKYQNKKYKILSKGWFRTKIVLYKYTTVFNLFWRANSVYVMKYNKQTEEFNDKIIKIVTSINEKSNIIKNISQNTYNLGSHEENIKFFIAVVDNIYSYDELTRLYEELENLKKK